MALALLEHAVALGDRAEITAWMSLVEEAMPAARPDLGPAMCPSYLAEMAIVLGQLADRARRQPTSWQEGLVVATLRCRDEVERPAGTREGAGERTCADDAWRWSSLEPETPLTGCLASAEVPGPRPPSGAQVRLELYAP